MQFGVLGPLRVVGDDGPIDIRARKQRALLAVLLLSHRDDAAPADRLVDALWGEDPPATAGKALQVYVSQLRRALGPGNPIVTRGAGYSADVEPGELDLECFEALVERARSARAAGDLDAAAGHLREAVALFRGAPLADAPLLGPAATEGDRLAGLRLAALEEAMDVELARGRSPASWRRWRSSTPGGTARRSCSPWGRATRRSRSRCARTPGATGSGAGTSARGARCWPRRSRSPTRRRRPGWARSTAPASWPASRATSPPRARFFEEGIAEALAQGDEVRAARCRGNLGNLLLYEHDYEQAVRHYEETRAYWARSGNMRGLSLILQNLGIAYEGSGRHADAVELLDESIGIARQVDDPAHLSSALRTQARILLADDDPAPALALLREGLALSHDARRPARDGGDAGDDGRDRPPRRRSPRGRAAIGAAAGTRAAAGAIRQPDEEQWVGGLETQLRAALGRGGPRRRVRRGRSAHAGRGHGAGRARGPHSTVIVATIPACSWPGRSQNST